VSPRFPGLPADEEAEILAAVRAGGARRRAAEERVYRGLREPLLALCLHLTGRRADAEDAVQETLAAVHRGLPSFRGGSRLSTWVYRIALRAALGVRSRRRDAEPLDPETPGRGGEGELAARDEARRVAAAVARLPAEPRLVLSLFAVDGLSHREIGEILGVPEGTVWSRLHAARRMLIESLSS
jgi:RNA polymerase sigma-70 factor (ECF subfamily)